MMGGIGYEADHPLGRPGSPACARARIAFIDNFDGASPGSWWTVLHENPDTYSVSGGQLHTQTMTRDIAWNNTGYTNLFLINNPSGAQGFVATMKVVGFTPYSDIQHINIIAYDDDDNHVRCVNGHTWGSRNREFLYEVGGQAGYGPGGGRAVMNPVAPDFYLRLTKTRNVYRQYYKL